MSELFSLSEEKGYFSKQGVDIMAFDDIYPAGHQSGVSIIMHGHRIATNGDIRFEPTPGQWQPVPKQLERVPDVKSNSITTTLSYPDTAGHLLGFNPMIYPDFEFSYRVKVSGEENGVRIRVTPDRPIPSEYKGKLCFNLELFPGALIGKPWIMDDAAGIFPPQANAPTHALTPNHLHSRKAPDAVLRADYDSLTGPDGSYNPITADDLVSFPYASGHKFTLCPDDPYTRITIESTDCELKLYDGRMNHNNGWFVISGEIPTGTADNAIEWTITPSVVDGWRYTPVVQVSQVGYHPAQDKKAIIEFDRRTPEGEIKAMKASLFHIEETGAVCCKTKNLDYWGEFLRYRYAVFDFSMIHEDGLYYVALENAASAAAGQDSPVSAVFKIDSEVYDRGVWQPVLEYFLPVQMCHMRVNEKYRVWHGRCHCDDGVMAPLNRVHFDGCVQGSSTFTSFGPGERVPGMDKGGWHDAGDFDLRIESQTGECYNLATAYEEFGIYYDETTIDEERQITEIHQPDGKNDILQQIEHGLLSILGAYKSMGRLYHDIICPNLRQYVLLGDPVNMTDGVPSDDDRLIFMENNPKKEFTSAAQLAACARAMRGYNDEMATDALRAAKEIYEATQVDDIISSSYAAGDQDATVHKDNARAEKFHAAVELYITTGQRKYRDYITDSIDVIADKADMIGWIAAKILYAFEHNTVERDTSVECAEFIAQTKKILSLQKDSLTKLCSETPYKIPYRPHIWGAGWGIQSLGAHYYYLHRAMPEVFGSELIFDSLNFVLGCHPGSNTSSFASGVGAKSTTVAYGFNRADWSYIPGGVVSGTALIRPDFPELLEFPYLWQQMEYVVGGGSTNYMFLVLAAKQIIDEACLLDM